MKNHRQHESANTLIISLNAGDEGVRDENVLLRLIQSFSKHQLAVNLVSDLSADGVINAIASTKAACELTWSCGDSSKFERRSAFVAGYNAAQQKATAAGLPIRTICAPSHIAARHLDLLAKYDIGAVIPHPVAKDTDASKRVVVHFRQIRSLLARCEAPSFGKCTPTSKRLRFGIWNMPVTHNIIGANARAIKVSRELTHALTSADARGDVAHVCFDIQTMAKHASALESFVASASRFVKQKKLRVSTPREIVCRRIFEASARKTAGAGGAGSILRAA